MLFPSLFRRIASPATAVAALAFFLGGAAAPSASPANPDITALGQVLGGITDDPASVNPEKPTLAIGEAELVLSAYLNPFIKAWFTLAGGEDGIGLEEAYASMVKGLPWGLGIKAGKYRLGFGNLNPVHPHAYPFIDAPRSLQSLLFGEEGFNETAVQASILLPTPGDWASMLSADLIEGRSFHGDESTRLGWLGRWSNDFLPGDKVALQAGLSGATGIDDVGRETRAYLGGADMKARFYLPASSHLTLQGEAVIRRFHTAGEEEEPEIELRSGFYAFADYRFRTRFNAGALYERWEGEEDPENADRAFRLYAGYAVLEESTVLRLAYERHLPAGGEAVNSVAVQLLFSMGPHKPHRF